ncbi:hypothetical protein C477_18080 [Haloterrigena salina JCM 13891]|uniref:Uncharacterized protein n=1 Tax=Haloterrigena salina JCM 13891 TaxID=1227488 RepID=M0BYG3_9EURY|nr:hypothetical protein C477_18080 [Haloterrigena salina JCM 13891]
MDLSGRSSLSPFQRSNVRRLAHANEFAAVSIDCVRPIIAGRFRRTVDASDLQVGVGEPTPALNTPTEPITRGADAAASRRSHYEA